MQPIRGRANRGWGKEGGGCLPEREKMKIESRRPRLSKSKKKAHSRSKTWENSSEGNRVEREADQKLGR